MHNLQIIGGSIIGLSECKSLSEKLNYTFGTPFELKEKLSEKRWKNANWSNFRRYSPHAKLLTLAVSVALSDCGIEMENGLTIGILVSDDFEHEEDQSSYFRDYVEGGRYLGGSSLFVHTLPTSAAVDASLSLGLRGPLMYIRNGNDIWGELMNTAGDFISNGDAEIMVISHRRVDTTVCLVLSAGHESDLSFGTISDPERVFEFAGRQLKR